MTTTSYTNNAIFENNQANALCDLLFTKLVAQFPPQIGDPENEFIFNSILLSGVAAAVLQAQPTKEIRNITFEIDNPDVYAWLQSNISQIFSCKVITYKERILFYPFDTLYFEIWFKTEVNRPLPINGIFVQSFAFINPETL